MNAKALLTLFDSVYLVALAAWVGSLLFFSFGVAPLIFGALSKESAAQLVRALFPRYYAWGATCGAIALPALVCGALAFPELRGWPIGAQAGLILAGVLVMLYCGNVLTPAINEARDAGPDQQARFDRLHQRSVSLNGLVIIVGVGLLAAFANRTPPKGEGIAEPDPGAYMRHNLSNKAKNDEMRRIEFRRQFGRAPDDPAPTPPASTTRGRRPPTPPPD